MTGEYRRGEYTLPRYEETVSVEEMAITAVRELVAALRGVGSASVNWEAGTVSFAVSDIDGWALHDTMTSDVSDAFANAGIHWEPDHAHYSEGA